MKNYLMRKVGADHLTGQTDDFVNFENFIADNGSVLRKYYRGKLYFFNVQSSYLKSYIEMDLKTNESETYMVNDSTVQNPLCLFVDNKIFMSTSKFIDLDTHTVQSMTLGETANLNDIKYVNGQYFMFTSAGVFVTNNLTGTWTKVINNSLKVGFIKNNIIYGFNFTSPVSGADYFTLKKYNLSDYSLISSENIATTQYANGSIYKGYSFVKGNDVYLVYNTFYSAVDPRTLYLCKINLENNNYSLLFSSANFGSGDNYALNNILSYDYINDELIVQGDYNGCFLIYDVGAESVVKADSNPEANTGYNRPTRIYNETKINVSGSNYNITTNALKRGDNDFLINPNNFIVLNFNPNTDYKITSLTSEKGTVTYDSETGVYTVYYASDDRYVEDNIVLVTEYNVSLDAGSYTVNVENLTTNFESQATEYDNIACYENEAFQFNKLKYENDTLEFILNDVVVKEISSGLVGLFLGEIMYGVSNELINAVTSYSMFFRNIKYNFTGENFEVSQEIVGGIFFEVTKWNGEDSDLAYYYFFDEGQVSLNITAEDGYKIDSIESDRGSVVDDSVVITAYDFRQNITINVNVEVVSGDFEVVLCNYEGTNITVNKKIKNEKIVRGNLVEPTSILSPSIIFELKGVPSYTYCYIKAFNRYYYINNITNVAFNLWRIDLSCDTIKTQESNIKASSGFIKRTSTNSSHLSDDRLVESGDTIIKTQEIEFALANHNFGEYESELLPDIYWSYVVNISMTACDIDSTVETQVSADRDSVFDILPAITRQAYDTVDGGHNTLIFSNEVSLDNFLAWLNQKGLNERIISVHRYPINLTSLVHTYAVTKIKVTKDPIQSTVEEYTTGSTSAVYLVSGVPQYYIHSTCALTTIDETNPYKCKYELYVPYASSVSLDYSEFKNTTIAIVYDFVLEQGEVNVTVLATNLNPLTHKYTSKIIYHCPTSCGVEFTFSKDDSGKLWNARNQQILNWGVDTIATSIHNLISSAPKGWAGVAQYGMKSAGQIVDAGAFSLKQDIADYYRISSSDTKISSGKDGMSLYQKAILVITGKRLLFSQSDVGYKEWNGLPYYKYDSINSMLNFTSVNRIYIEIEETNIQFSDYITREEQNEIRSILASGVQFIKESE